MLSIKKHSMVKLLNGFSILGTMVALVLFGILLTILQRSLMDIWYKQQAQIIVKQTHAFAHIFARYIYVHSTEIKNHTILNLAPSDIKDWPVQQPTTNLLFQTPCVSILWNKHHQDIIMYYMDGREKYDTQYVNMIRNSANKLGGYGGIMVDDTIFGNSGWSMNHLTSLLLLHNHCGTSLSNNSLVLKLDLMPQINFHRYSITAVMRGIDQESQLLSLPGHNNNLNTLHTSISFALGKGIILSNANKLQPIKISLQNTSESINPPTITIGTGVHDNTILIADTLQAKLSFRAGDPCLSSQLGKIVIDAGLETMASKYLSRSTLVCTKNAIFCGANHNCYLSAIANHVIFQNNSLGIQNNKNEFICPSVVPYATNITLGQPTANIYVFYNYNKPLVHDSIYLNIGNANGSNVWYNFSCPSCSDPFHTDFKNSSFIAQLLAVDLGQIGGNGVAHIALPIAQATSIIGSANGYSVNIGYILPPNNTCATICSHINTILNDVWQPLGTQRYLRIKQEVNVLHANLGCACERADFKGNWDSYNGISAIIGQVHTIITSVTCSNSPVFNSSLN